MDIIEATKVTINGKTHICKTIPEVWELVGLQNGTLTEEGDKARTKLLRELFIHGKIECTIYGTPVVLEIVPVE